MRLCIQTSNSELNTISDFKYLFDLARCSKCQNFILLKEKNQLFGASDDSCCIHVIDIPFIVNTDLMFRMDADTKRIVDSYDEFFVPDKYQNNILPSYYWNMYVNGDIIAEYAYDLDQFILLDKTTKQPIDQIFMAKTRESYQFMWRDFMNQLEHLLYIDMSFASKLYTFEHMEQDPYIRQVFDSKASTGAVLCQLKNQDINIRFYLFKGLFSLAKADTLTIQAFFDGFNTNQFLLIFSPKKKKNPLILNTYGVPFSEKIYGMYVMLM